VSRRIEHQVGHLQLAVLSSVQGGPAKERPHPGQQLLQREGLDQVVVGSGVQPLHSIFDRVPRREHEHWSAVSDPAQQPADLQAVDARHQDVEHDQVRGDLPQPVQGLVPVGRQVDLVPLAGQGALERVPHRGLVVDHQDVRIVQLDS
jgi:hypothetical protein